MSRIEQVNLLQGANSHFGMSQGNCFPLTALPFGMTHWCLQTGEGPWVFEARARKVQGVRATHQPSPWIGDYGHFVVMAQVGEPRVSCETRSSAYRPDRTVFRPDTLCADLIRYDIRLEMTPTERCAVFRFRFPATEQARVLLDPCAGESGVWVDTERSRVEGYTRGSTGGTPENFACYFVAIFNCPMTGCLTFENGKDITEASERTGPRAGAAVTFTTQAGETVEMKIATSFLSIEQAERNLAREVGDRDFETVRTQARQVWEQALGRIEVEGGTEAQQRVFASCLYRMHLFPRKWHEYDDAGEPVHFSPYDGQAHPGVLYTDNGFWDTYRTVYPLLALLLPEQLNEILEGWTQACREGGWFPQWASPGYRACMVGTHVDAVMADAVARGVRGFDVATAYAGLRRHAFEPGDAAGSYGRIGILDYLEKGYVSTDHHESVARALDYAYDDFCIAQVAAALGKEDDRRLFLERAQNYRHHYDPSVGFMRARNADGSWAEFREFRWGDPYVEGGPWQSTWAVPHDPAGLIALMGGPEAFVAQLERMLTMPPHFEVGYYGFEIHEMTEMACVDFGQYAHSNQPVHHVLYLFTAAGRPDRTQYWVRRVLNELYTPDVFPGDEDNGEMSAWYVLSALGLFPLCPGHPSWVFGSPLFPRARITLPDGGTLTIEAERENAAQLYTAAVTLDGKRQERLWIDHATVSQGGVLRFTLTETPTFAPAYSSEALPFSLSTGEIVGG